MCDESTSDENNTLADEECGSQAALLSIGLNETPGALIGPYKLLERLGEGGFGTVWRVEQREPVARQVALKIIKLGMDTREVIARFEAERQTLALMEHPHIARVYDAGATDSGRPYFVMELVRGIPVTEFAKQEGLDLRARLALFSEICAAVNHAHQKGVIHRDLKPSNILVNSEGDRAVPKIIDFGIAKAAQPATSEDPLFTRAGELMGTPLYMSPEQVASGGIDLDTRSDIYSLGVVLYELLTDRPPFDLKRFSETGLDEIRRIIREEDPPRPSDSAAEAERAKALRSELDWVVLKALEKDRSRRYETANALMQDIQRYLDGDNVVAAPPTAGYRLRKTLARHRVAFVAGSAVALALLVGTGAALWQAADARNARDAAHSALAAAQGSESKAQGARSDAEETIAFLVETFDQSDGKTTLVDMLGHAEERLAGRFTDQPGTRVRLLAALADANSGLGINHRSNRLWSEAVALAEGHLSDQPDLIFKLKQELAADLIESDRLRCEELTRENLAFAQEHYGENDKRTLACEVQLASVAMRKHGDNRTPEFAKQAERALLGAHKHCREHLGDEDGLSLACLDLLALLRTDESKPAEALEIYDQLYAIRSRKAPDSIDFFEQLHFMADIKRTLHDYPASVEYGRRALDGFARTLGEAHSRTQNVRQHLGWSELSAGDPHAAGERFEQNLALARKSPGDVDALAGALATLAHFRENRGRPELAIELHREAAGRLRDALGDGDRRVIAASEALLRAMLMVASRGDGSFLEEAEDLALKIFNEQREARRNDPSLPEPMQLRLAAIRRYQGRPSESRALLKEALAITATQPWLHQSALDEAVFTHSALGDYVSALDAQRQKLALDPEAPTAARQQFRLALLLILKGETAPLSDLHDKLSAESDEYAAAAILLADHGTLPAELIDQSAAMADRALEETPGFPRTLYAGVAALRKRQADDAIERLKNEAAHELRSIAVPALAYTAVAHFDLGQAGLGEDALRKAEVRARADQSPLVWSDNELNNELRIEIALREAKRARRR